MLDNNRESIYSEMMTAGRASWGAHARENAAQLRAADVGVVVSKKKKKKPQSWTVAKVEKQVLFRTLAIREKRPLYRTGLHSRYNKTSGNL